MSDLVNHPAHYCQGKIEPIDVIEDWDLGFHLGNVVKYVRRMEHKGTRTQDVRKAIWYLNRYMAFCGVTKGDRLHVPEATPGPLDGTAEELIREVSQ